MRRREFLSACLGLASLPAQQSRRPEPIPSAPPPALPPEEHSLRGRQWRSQFLFDDDKWSAVIADFCCPSPERAVAALWLESGFRQRFAALISREPGAPWTEVPLRERPISFFALDEKHLWLAGEKSLWFSAESGFSWEKLSLPRFSRSRGAHRVCFLDARNGWAFGRGKTFHRTTDGGSSWKPVAECAGLELREENTVWTSMTFLDARHGLIAGFSDPRLDESGEPADWMLPERTARRRAVPITTVAGETRDGGATWKFSVTSAFGRAVRLRSSGNRGIAIYHYGDNFVFPSEVFALDFRTGESRPVFRREDYVVHDAALLETGAVVLAAIRTPGRLRSAPVPGKLAILYSEDLREWGLMKVDYRAEGRRAMLAAPAPGSLWAATDEGCVLRLV
jgi:photosystem II stability/assembly factor-like uncharacterized protein